MAHKGLLGPIRERVRAGGPFIGWSAGANVACPTIRTTNDMPIVEPPTLDALGFLPFQINPHYTDARMPDHSGETRAERLLEFIEVNPDVPVLGLREGSILRVEGPVMTLLGDKSARVFRRTCRRDRCRPT
jgi:dipeptidase E